MAHAGEELGLGLACDVGLLLVDLALDHPAQLRQVMMLLRVVQKLRRDAQDAQVPHVVPAVIQGQHDALLPRRGVQETSQRLPPAVVRREVPHLLLAQPAEKSVFLLFLVFPHGLRGPRAAGGPLVAQVIGIEVRPQQGHQHPFRLIRPADLPYHQHHLRGEIGPLPEKVQGHGHQAHAAVIAQRIELMLLDRRQWIVALCGHVTIEQVRPPRARAHLEPGQLRHADHPLGAVQLLRPGQTGAHPDIEGLLLEARLERLQQPCHELGRLRLALALQPQHELVPVQAQGHRPAPRLAGELPASRPDQLAQLLQDHVPEHDAVLLVDLLELVQEQIHHDAVRPDLPVSRQLPDAGAGPIQAGHAVHGRPPELLGLPFLLLLDVMDGPHQPPAPSVRIVDHLACERHPGVLRVPRPLYPELRVQIVGLALQGLDGLRPVRLVDGAGAGEPGARSAALPLPAHGAVVHDVQHPALQVIGEKDVLG